MRPMFVCLAILLTAACTKAEDASSAPKGKSELVGKLDALADEACGCKDLACADAAAKKLDALAASMKPSDVGEDEVAPAQAAQQRFDTCHAGLVPQLADYTKLTDEICACGDKACGQKVSAKVSKWAAALKASGTKLRQGDVGVFSTIGKKGAACFQKLGLPIPQ
jgi:hypothetical protein